MFKKMHHFLLIALLSSLAFAEGEGSMRVLRELENAQIVDKAGAELPKDVILTTQDGLEVSFGSYFDGTDKRPAILFLGYNGCPQLCSVVLNGFVNGVKNLRGLTPGDDFRMLFVSIDPREKPELAKKKQSAYAKAIDLKNTDDWMFHVTSEQDAKKLADAAGFNYYFDKKNNQFAHGAGLFVISPKGVLSRTLFGIEFKPGDIKLALNEAADGKIGSFVEQLILSCFHYDPDSHRYGVYIWGVMRLGGLLTILILGGVLLMYFRQERRRIDPLV